jgi:hypothetical protein
MLLLHNIEKKTKSHFFGMVANQRKRITERKKQRNDFERRDYLAKSLSANK